MLVAVVLFVVILLIGAAFVVNLREQPKSPFAEIPRAVVDHLDNTTKVSIRGQEDTLYNRIEIRFVDRATNATTSVGENLTYTLAGGTRLPDFTLNLSATVGTDVYTIEVNITVVQAPGGVVSLRIEIPDPPGPPTVEEYPRSRLPWQTYLLEVDRAG